MARASGGGDSGGGTVDRILARAQGRDRAPLVAAATAAIAAVWPARAAGEAGGGCRIARSRARLVVKGTTEQGTAIEQEPLGIAQALDQVRIVLQAGLPLPLQELEALLQLHQALREQVERAGEILRAAADPERNRRRGHGCKAVGPHDNTPRRLGPASAPP